MLCFRGMYSLSGYDYEWSTIDQRSSSSTTASTITLVPTSS